MLQFNFHTIMNYFLNAMRLFEGEHAVLVGKMVLVSPPYLKPYKTYHLISK